ncbi:site-specific DNA-methyltransferase [Aliivibrio sp. S4TY2]|uniref:DNA-methyltransferase n=1 Tax=unclassified Aliivibrio TaxID=2645654 RepID=UPI002379D563|nr:MULTISPECIES: site-specific DNA-methyltransferase [unclassified Aliivibrio]MDD9158524.1 site-specific DNA-methyltransferase [Aliivibrio sp. S4TY2]MDD9162522.1 site-specific DNA-methyltransferase [Aliivibrio sp. S4TY1]MDD9166523.1 site-specific DNA-methyltransferase [Aliivibrio sp. S4MY2]MDD9170521.1 site-specific DNA-methyltransferase [Aliivibrio sp. S4MY4]MDD9187598.1 site-specific DNA-methyltransferase [Aliivibrio sp. S4MY3]
MHTTTLHNGQLQLIHADCLNYLKTLPDNSINLILTDPPYFQVKKNAWDNQWPNIETFLAWLDEVSVELWRVLKPSGNLYLFCGSKLAADTELLIRARFDVFNHIVWAKPSGVWKRTHKPHLRSFFPATERIIFAGHYESEGFAKGCSQYATKCTELKKTVFKPLMDYFKNAKDALNISTKEINQATGTQMCSHWFSSSQWKLPTEAQYRQLQELFASKSGQLSKTHSELTNEYQVLHSEYGNLVKEYDELKAEYETLRRPFNVTAEVPYTDVWTFAPVQYYPGKHPCEKPADLLEHIIESSSRENAVVLDAFMGSGSTGKACLTLNRQFIGIEMEEDTYTKTVSEFTELTE